MGDGGWWMGVDRINVCGLSVMEVCTNIFFFIRIDDSLLENEIKIHGDTSTL